MPDYDLVVTCPFADYAHGDRITDPDLVAEYNDRPDVVRLAKKPADPTPGYPMDPAIESPAPPPVAKPEPTTEGVSAAPPAPVPEEA